MTIPEVISIVGLGIVGLGLLATWIRNGRSASEKLGSLKTDVVNIQKSLDNSECGLGALSFKISEFKENCAKVSSTLSERVAAQGKAIDELKIKRK